MPKIDGRKVYLDVYDLVIKLKEESGLLREVDHPNNDYIRITCPIHKSGNERSASAAVYCGEEKDIHWHCFSCGESGDVAHFISSVLKYSRLDAVKWLVDNYGEYFDTTRFLPELPKMEIIEKTNPELEDISSYDTYHPYLLERGISRETAEKFNLRYKDSEIYFPITNESGNIIALNKRSVKTKFYTLQENVKKDYVFGLNECKRHLGSYMIITEGPFDMLKCWEFDTPGVCLFGIGNKDQILNILKSRKTNYFLALDPDSAGDKGRRYFKKIASKFRVNVYDILLPEGQDIGSLDEQEFNHYVKEFIYEKIIF